MSMLTITDLPRAETMQRDAMSAVRGGIAYIVKPDNGGSPPFVPPSTPKSWPGAEILKSLGIPLPWPASPAPQPAAQDPRLL